MQTIFESWAGFVAANPLRADSEQHPIGEWFHAESRTPAYRLTWLSATEELLLHKFGAGGQHGDAVDFAIERIDVPGDAVQVIGWIPRCEDPGLPLDHWMQNAFPWQLALERGRELNSLSWVKHVVDAHALAHPTR